jgi:DNA-binding FadR family transcriptional regulator
MNVDPKSSINYNQAIEKTKRMNQGARHSVGDERLTERQIAERLKMSRSVVFNALQKESADHFVSRIKRKRAIHL